jgi:hypothetical protein
VQNSRTDVGSRRCASSAALRHRREAFTTLLSGRGQASGGQSVERADALVEAAGGDDAAEHADASGGRAGGVRSFAFRSVAAVAMTSATMPGLSPALIDSATSSSKMRRRCA